MYDYALLSARVGAYRSFWDFATEGPQPSAPVTYQSVPTVPIVQPTIPMQTRPIIQSAPVVPVQSSYSNIPAQSYTIAHKLKVTFFAYFVGCTPPEAGYSHAI